MNTKRPDLVGYAMAGFALALLTISLVGCPKKETPGPEPTPAPTAVEIPTPYPGSDAACARAYSMGGGSQVFYECRDAVGEKVACPENPENLPKCPE